MRGAFGRAVEGRDSPTTTGEGIVTDGGSPGASPVSPRDQTDARAAYYNLRTCICGEDAGHHRCRRGNGSFDPDWETVRERLEARQMLRSDPPRDRALPDPPPNVPHTESTTEDTDTGDEG